MFWYLVLAHLLGDYPLQPTWMVNHKTNFWVLLLHVTIHFALMLSIIYPYGLMIWPMLLVLTGLHFCIDASKNWLKIHRPTWITWPYILDQLAHLITLMITTTWISSRVGGLSPALPIQPVIYASGFLLATYVWLITERVLSLNVTDSAESGIPLPWQRMFYRASFFAIFILGWRALEPAAAASSIVLPYSNTRQGIRFLMTDGLVTAGCLLLVILAGR